MNWTVTSTYAAFILLLFLWCKFALASVANFGFGANFGCLASGRCECGD